MSKPFSDQPGDAKFPAFQQHGKQGTRKVCQFKPGSGSQIGRELVCLQDNNKLKQRFLIKPSANAGNWHRPEIESCYYGGLPYPPPPLRGTLSTGTYSRVFLLIIYLPGLNGLKPFVGRALTPARTAGIPKSDGGLYQATVVSHFKPGVGVLSLEHMSDDRSWLTGASHGTRDRSASEINLRWAVALNSGNCGHVHGLRPRQGTAVNSTVLTCSCWSGVNASVIDPSVPTGAAARWQPQVIERLISGALDGSGRGQERVPVWLQERFEDRQVWQRQGGVVRGGWEGRGLGRRVRWWEEEAGRWVEMANGNLGPEDAGRWGGGRARRRGQKAGLLGSQGRLRPFS
ncbi:hypothetical protein HPP92_028809 [Vanilla planifolia]|uniref:Uncharacterized protein n=1 Tax=Vanilla planifolia TaxID=51239 RepID=A0A835P9L1_VANPL|nr:hypothetical protein HPP92_028809 [Vanilla planifolia]KAG0446509.1 hypothetical protein HPP92_028798 [Vanilla planifolia]